VIVALLGVTNVLGTCFVLAFRYFVKWSMVPQSARQLFWAFLIYYGTTFAFLAITIAVFGSVRVGCVVFAAIPLYSILYTRKYGMQNSNRACI
jgi:hypothetical protein